MKKSDTADKDKRCTETVAEEDQASIYQYFGGLRLDSGLDQSHYFHFPDNTSGHADRCNSQMQILKDEVSEMTHRGGPEVVPLSSLTPVPQTRRRC